MTANEIEAFCLSLPGATVVEQWGGCRVFKVGGKMFALLGPKGDHLLQGLSLKVSEDSFHILIRDKNIVPAPYLARAKWVLLQRLNALNARELRAYLARAHVIVTAGLSKKKQAALGILPGQASEEACVATAASYRAARRAHNKWSPHPRSQYK